MTKPLIQIAYVGVVGVVGVGKGSFSSWLSDQDGCLVMGVLDTPPTPTTPTGKLEW
jgi:hypothetical protein